MKMKLWEKIFIILNIVVIISIISFYTYRAIKYYKITNVIVEQSKLIDILDKKIIYNGDGLYKEDSNYYFKGKNVNNYVLYNNLLYRIISIDENGIKLILNDSITTLVYGVKDLYIDSNINNYLNNTLINNFNKEELVSSKWCNNPVDVNNYECNIEIDNYIGLLTSKEYLKAGGKDSYLNNNTYFWLINTTLENEKLYVNSNGGINNKDRIEDEYLSYGVRPVIVVKRDIENLKGDGSIDKPYVISSNMDAIISNHSIGTYVKMGNYTFRIVETNENYTKLILDGVLENKYNYSNGIKYINNEFISEFNIDNLVKSDCYINTYNKGNSYSLVNGIKSSSYACLPNIGDLFITEYDNIWLNTKYNNSLIYTINGNSVFADLSTSENYIRPILSVKSDLIISSGEGTKNSPLVLGDNNETNN